MSKHNYSQYSNKKKSDGSAGTIASNAASGKPSVNTANSKTEATAKVESKTVPSLEPVTTSAPKVKMEVAPVELVHETVDTVTLPNTVEGVVANCAKLNVRAEPDIDAEVVCVLDAMSEIKIDVAKSTRDWFKVYTAIGGEGYCMRKFVDAHL